MAYIGNTAANRFVAPEATTRLSGNGSATAFTLEHSVGSDEDILVSVDGVIQEPSVAYAVSNGTTLTFTAAPSNGTNNIFVCYLFRTVGTVSHPSNNALSATSGTFSGAVTANAGVVVDNITIDGTEIDLSSGDLTVDSAGQIILDYGSGAVLVKAGGTDIGKIHNSSTDFVIESITSDEDILFKGNDGGSTITALTLDMSASGEATFNSGVFANTEIDVKTSSGVSTISASATGSCNLVMGTNFSGSTSQGMVNQSGFLNMRQDFPIIFGTSETERMRIFGSGNITFSTTNQSPAEGTSTGGRIGTSGKVQLSSTGASALIANRVQDGAVVEFRSAGGAEGSVSISGSTTSYNAFSGSHWSRLTDNSKPTILKGTIVENIDEMCDWYQVEFKVDGSTQKASYTLKDGEKVGDTITYTYKQDDVEDADYSATIIKEDDNKHTKCKISDTADSKKVYGVFADWDNDDDTVNDMYVTAVGTHVVRINKDVTVSAGDLLSSNGDGTAKVQDDDIIRSKTIGKVLTNIKQETYDDGSYTVPCALYCG